MLELYDEMKIQLSPTESDVDKLFKFHDTVGKAISDYYEYLKKTGIPVKDSSLTHWLMSDHYEEITHYLMLLSI